MPGALFREGYATEHCNEEAARALWVHGARGHLLAVEVLPGIYGATTGSDQIDAERWAGRFIQAWEIGWQGWELGMPIKREGRDPLLVHRAKARAVVTGSSRARDADVRAAIVDLYGGQERAFGKRCPRCKGIGLRGAKQLVCGECGGEGWLVPKGPLHGWTGSHLFAALAVAIAAMEPRKD